MGACILTIAGLAAMVSPVGAVAGEGRPPAAAAPAGQPTGSLESAVACTPTSVLDSWPLQSLADQTIVFPVEEADVAAAAGAAEAGYGGLILFGTSAPSDLGSELAALQADAPDHLGLMVMTDEEGGGVQRMANLVGSMPWAAQMGKTMTPAQIKALAESVGSRMLASGVGMNLAPVLDVDGRAVLPGQQDPDGFRSFSGETPVVTADGAAFMEGMVDSGVVPVVKHFPGLGGVSENTDDGPAWTLPWSTLEKVALPPFEAAINEGAPAVMVSNAKVRGFTSVPASISAKLVTGELREALGFKGLIVTDSLSAGALSDPPLSLSVPAAAVDSLEAGDDMVLFGSTGTTSGDLSLAAATSDAIVSAVTSGALQKSTLVNAAAEVLATKKVNLCPGYWLSTGAGNVYNFGRRLLVRIRGGEGRCPPLSWRSPPRRTAAATGSRPPPATSTTSATPPGTDPRRGGCCPPLSWRSPPRRTAAATGSRPPPATSTTSATPPGTDPRRGGCCPPLSWRSPPRRTAAATGSRPPPATSTTSATPPGTDPRRGGCCPPLSWRSPPRRRDVGYWLTTAKGNVYNLGSASFLRLGGTEGSAVGGGGNGADGGRQGLLARHSRGQRLQPR